MTEPPEITEDTLFQQPPYALIAYFEMASQMAGRQPDDARLTSHLLSSLCLAYADEERYEEAIATGQRALRIATSLPAAAVEGVTTEDHTGDDIRLLAAIYQNLGVAYARSGDLERGLASYHECWSHARLACDEDTAFKAARNIMTCLASGQPIGEAEFALLQDCLPEFEAAALYSETVRATQLIGKGLLDQGRTAEAIGILDHVLSLTESVAGGRKIRRETVLLLQEAERALTHPTGVPVQPPRLGPGTLTEVRRLVDDGVENLRRASDDRAGRCFSRALIFLSRRDTQEQRALAAFVMFQLMRLATHRGDNHAEAEMSASALAELELIDPDLGQWVKARELVADLDDLRTLARAAERQATAPKTRGRGWRRVP